ncbi:hypothetical protein [Kitasatospora sp. NPDC004289]
MTTPRQRYEAALNGIQVMLGQLAADLAKLAFPQPADGPEPAPECGTFTSCDGHCCEKPDPAPHCCECGSLDPGRPTFYENFLGHLLCWPCADGDRLCDCHQPPARLSQHVQPPNAEERLKAAEATIGAVREARDRWRGRGDRNADFEGLWTAIGEALGRYSKQPPVGSLKAEWVPNDPSEKCRCSHASAAHTPDACRTCAEDGLGTLHKHPFIAR